MNMAGMFPTEGIAMAFPNLDAVRNHVGLAAAVFAALEVVVGDFNDAISSVALIPEAVWRASVANARVIVQAAVPANIQPPNRLPLRDEAVQRRRRRAARRAPVGGMRRRVDAERSDSRAEPRLRLQTALFPGTPIRLKGDHSTALPKFGDNRQSPEEVPAG